ncbi:hypothetical protein [Metapseudomonas furukawaii]|uniref:hypothetical protein n=1 Tax=Metapseudomonas furukawaii TaxID=1149133 RepID=UPI00055BD3B3|nr:hypothetical protein [Pseudomonas furukawaii]
MSEAKFYKWEYRRRTWSFSLSSIAVVLMTGAFLATHRSMGTNINDIEVLVVGGVAFLIYLFKRVIWLCPACGHGFEMGDYDQAIRCSILDSCPIFKDLL